MKGTEKRMESVGVSIPADQWRVKCYEYYLSFYLNYNTVYVILTSKRDLPVETDECDVVTNRSTFVEGGVNSELLGGEVLG